MAPIDIGRFDLAAIAAQVRIAEVIGKDNDHVGALVFPDLLCRRHKPRQEGGTQDR